MRILSWNVVRPIVPHRSLQGISTLCARRQNGLQRWVKSERSVTLAIRRARHAQLSHRPLASACAGRPRRRRSRRSSKPWVRT